MNNQEMEDEEITKFINEEIIKFSPAEQEDKRVVTIEDEDVVETQTKISQIQQLVKSSHPG